MATRDDNYLQICFKCKQKFGRYENNHEIVKMDAK